MSRWDFQKLTLSGSKWGNHGKLVPGQGSHLETGLLNEFSTPGDLNRSSCDDIGDDGFDEKVDNDDEKEEN